MMSSRAGEFPTLPNVCDTPLGASAQNPGPPVLRSAPTTNSMQPCKIPGLNECVAEVVGLPQAAPAP